MVKNYAKDSAIEYVKRSTLIHALENPDTVHFISWEIPEDCSMQTSHGDIIWKSQPKETKSSFTSRVKEEVLKLSRERPRREIYLCS